MLVGCFVGGLIIGIGGGVTTNAFVFTSLLTIPAFDNIVLYSIAVAAAFELAGTPRARFWFAVAAAALFIWFYPIISAAALPNDQAFNRWMWFDSWR